MARLREVAATHLAEPGLTRNRVLACAARLLDIGFFRIGTEGYAEENQTYGLATMRKEHVSISGGVITFDYVAKSGKHRIATLADEDVLAVVQELKRRRTGGPELLAWRDDDGAWVDVKSNDINDYVKEATGGGFTAKDFRTWSATVLAAVALAVLDRAWGNELARATAASTVALQVRKSLAVKSPPVCSLM